MVPGALACGAGATPAGRPGWCGDALLFRLLLPLFGGKRLQGIKLEILVILQVGQNTGTALPAMLREWRGT